ncbi:hypothetical protein DET49_10966 [Salegentibacter sp. 24]|uniref:hypothetical protein n=1 Tax=Salegentibacter sp. 24 TaxID=2183986 RepID=UPI00105D3681|nr:hypothetical protein [Salegentibacter sp. 24]TDN88116.1 hypothetical protein DET49_10966 [Salegentibacter sp. 24]
MNCLNSPIEKHKFYIKSNKEQTLEILKFSGLALLIFLGFVLIGLFLEWYFLPLLALPLILSVLAPFIDTPQGKKQGKLIYYTPLFITEKIKNEKIIIHGGTLFDYYYVLDRNWKERQRIRFILRQYILGLLKLSESFHAKNAEYISLEGTSYILNERTAEKLGFHKKRTNFLQQFILTYNYLQILLANSIAKGKLSFPDLARVNTYTAPLSAIKQNKIFLKQLADKLKD